MEWFFNPIDHIIAILKQHVDLVLLAYSVFVLVIHFFGRIDKVFMFLLSALALVSLLLFAIMGFQREPAPFSEIASILVAYGSSSFVLLSESLLSGGARRLTAWRGEKWTKEMDYLYLTLGAVGIFGSLSRIDFLTERFEGADIFAPIVLVTAVVIRFIKTRAEIGEWNKFK